MNMYVSAREYASGEEMRQAYAARRVRLMGRQRPVNWKPEPVQLPKPKPKPAPILIKPELVFTEINELTLTSIDVEPPEWMRKEIYFNAHCFHSTVKQYATCRAEQMGYSFAEITGRTRKRAVVLVRQLIIWEVRTSFRPSMSLPELGRIMGGLDHTTVLHSVRKIQAMKNRGEI